MLTELGPSEQKALGINEFQLRIMHNLAPPIAEKSVKKADDNKPFTTTRVIIDGRGSLVGSGPTFSAKVFMRRLKDMLREAGADAEQVSYAF